MIYRVRIDACGSSAAAVEEALLRFADVLDPEGELEPRVQVIERDLNEELDSGRAFKGRLLLHRFDEEEEEEVTTGDWVQVKPPGRSPR